MFVVKQKKTSAQHESYTSGGILPKTLPQMPKLAAVGGFGQTPLRSDCREHSLSGSYSQPFAPHQRAQGRPTTGMLLQPPTEYNRDNTDSSPEDRWKNHLE